MAISTVTYRPLTLLATLALFVACDGEDERAADNVVVQENPSGQMPDPSTGATSSITPGPSNPDATGPEETVNPGGSSNPVDDDEAAGGSAGTSATAGGPGVDTGGPSGGAPAEVGGAGGADTGNAAGGGMNPGSAGTGMGGSDGVSGSGGAGGAEVEAPSPLPPTDDYSDFGPFETTSETGTGPDGTYTIVRPDTLGEDGFLHAPLIFGPGIGGAPSSMMNLLQRIASHGFVIISRQLDGPPGDTENNRRMIDGLDWLIEQNTTAGSIFEGKLAVEHAISMGYSVGGTAAVDIGGHDAIVTVVSIHGHQAEPLEESNATFLLMGGENDVMNDGRSWLAPTYEALEAQTFFSLVEGADHGYPGRTVDGVQAGVETPAMIAWIRYWVYNDQEATRYFFGDDCVMCSSPWTNTQRKNGLEASRLK